MRQAREGPFSKGEEGAGKGTCRSSRGPQDGERGLRGEMGTFVLPRVARASPKHDEAP